MNLSTRKQKVFQPNTQILILFFATMTLAKLLSLEIAQIILFGTHFFVTSHSSRELTGTRHKKEMDFFCSALVFFLTLHRFFDKLR